MYERRSVRPLPHRKFLWRLAGHFAVALAVVLGSLVLGMLGYHHFEGLGWADAFVNTAMLLGGMGPVDVDLTPEGKVFAGCFALYAGLVFVAVTGIILVPVVHRVLHHFHWDEKA